MNPKPILQFLIGIGIILMTIGYMFRIMHWPHEKLMIILAYALILIVYPRIILLKKKRNKLDLIKVAGVFIWGGFGITYYYYFPDHRTLISAISQVGLVIWAGVSIYIYFFHDQTETSSKTKLINIGYLVGLGGLAVGFFFKTMHWPGATMFMVIGAVISGITFFYAAFINSEE